MDTMTYVVVVGWVCMYFIPSFSLAFLTATVLALGASLLVTLSRTGGEGLELAAFMEAALPVAPVSFFAIFMAWPLGVFFRRLKQWVQRKAAGA